MAEGVDEVGGQPVDKAVAVVGLDPLVVVREADDGPVGADADQQGASVGVEERGDGLDDGVLHELAGLVFPEIPAGGRLELDGVVLVVVDELLDGPQLGFAGEAEFLGHESHELGIGAELFDDLVGERSRSDRTRRYDGDPADVSDRFDGCPVVDAVAVVAVGGGDVVEDRLDLGVEHLRRVRVSG